MATTTTTDDEIVALENAYWQAMKDEDTEAALELTYEPCVVASAGGAETFDHAAMRKMNENKTWALKEFSLDNMHVQTVNDISVLAYTAKLDMEVEGKSLSREFVESSAWVKQDGKWQCVLHTETPVGDPYGRDKDAKKK